jgi:hypothetical protein
LDDKKVPKRSVTLAVSRAVRWNNTPTFPLLLSFFKKKEGRNPKVKRRRRIRGRRRRREMEGVDTCWFLCVLGAGYNQRCAPAR